MPEFHRLPRFMAGCDHYGRGWALSIAAARAKAGGEGKLTARLFLVASGVTAATRAAAFPRDEPLEAAAAEQAARLALRLRRIDEARCAPELRARQTAAALSLDAAPDERLRNWNAGRWAGKSIAALGEEEPAALQAWMSDPAAAPHGGEPLLALLARTGAWLDDRISLRGRLAAVTHPEVARAALVHVLGAAPSAFWRIDVEPLGIAELRSDGRRWALRGLVNPLGGMKG